MPTNVPLPQPRIEVISPTKIIASSGRVLWLEDFESNVLKVSGASIVNTAQKVRGGAYALKITSAAGAPFLTECHAKVIGIRPECFSTKCGIELYFMLESDTTAAGGTNEFNVRVYSGNGTNKLVPGVKIILGATAAGMEVAYFNSGGTDTNLSGGPYTIQSAHYFRLKMIWDPVAEEYISITWGDLTWDLSGIGLRKDASGNRITDLYLSVDGIDATTQSVWVDDIILTTNEP